MKIFSIKGMLGLAALYGAARYARKHGGVRHAATDLLDQVRQAADQRREQRVAAAAAPTSSPS